MVHPIFQRMLKNFPGLKQKLEQADKNVDPAVFLQQCAVSAFYISIGLGFGLFMLFVGLNQSPVIPIVAFPISFVLFFFYFTKTPDLIILKKGKKIDQEIVFAGKFMIIELNSGISLYDVMKNIGSQYGGIGTYFNRIVQDIDLGTETQDAINKAIIMSPSDNFRKILWQLSNSLRTGANVGDSLDSVLEQIGKQQLIAVERYGKKLNPIAMFYLMLAVILPSLGMVMGVVVVSFVGIELPLFALIGIALVLTFVQFIFYATIKSNRPAVDM